MSTPDLQQDLSQVERLPRLIEQASTALANAKTAAEVLDAKRQADAVYSVAKTAERFAKIKDAHATVIAACRKAMADALVIEAQAQVRLADEYDAAQARGDVHRAGQPKKRIIPNENNSLAIEDTGLTSKQVHEARIVRDAEHKAPGIVRKTVQEKLQANKEPTRADVKRAVSATVAPKHDVRPKASTKPSSDTEHERIRREAKAEPAHASSSCPCPLFRAAGQIAEAEPEARLQEAEEDTSSELDDAIDVIFDHLETLESDGREFVDQYILLPLGLASKRITRRDKLTWEPWGRAFPGCYMAQIMKETDCPFYFLIQSKTDENLYGVSICVPVSNEILVDNGASAMPLAETKKFCEARHAEEVDT